MKVLVTGAAGFIGMFTARLLLERGDTVVGIDNFNDYYDVRLKEDRAKQLAEYDAFDLQRIDLADRAAMEALFRNGDFEAVVHLGAQAGVRYSLENPHSYIDSNIVGTTNILEGCRHHGIRHLVYASSSSVYGANTAMPFSTHQGANHPLALYGATKKANEMMAHAYSHLFGLPTTGLRFFTVYGPWGRPDMSPILFASRIAKGEPIDVFNYGKHSRDFTYVEDIVEGVVRTLDRPAAPNPDWDPKDPDPASSAAPYRVYNIGNQEPVDLMRFIELIEQGLGRTAKKNLLPMQPGDVADTWADTSDLAADVGYAPGTPVEVGVKNFVEWFVDYYGPEPGD